PKCIPSNSAQLLATRPIRWCSFLSFSFAKSSTEGRRAGPLPAGDRGTEQVGYLSIGTLTGDSTTVGPARSKIAGTCTTGKTGKICRGSHVALVQELESH